MPAPKENQNAQKWTEKRVRYYLRRIDKAGRNPKNLFWGRILKKLGLYKDIWRYWRQKYGHIGQIAYAMDLIETIYESNLSMAALNRQIPAWLAMICLRNNHGWGKEVQAIAEEIQDISDDGAEEIEADIAPNVPVIAMYPRPEVEPAMAA